MSKLKNSDVQLIKTVSNLQDKASTLCIMDTLQATTGRYHSIASLHHALKRLTDQGFIDSVKTEATAIRGDRRKRIFHVTAYGYKSINHRS
mgnify:FL=1